MSPLLAATRQPSRSLAAPSRATTRNRTPRTGSPRPRRSRWLGTLCASPRAESKERSLPAGRGQRETVRMRAIPPAPGKALGQSIAAGLARYVYPQSCFRRKSTSTVSFESPFSLVPRKNKQTNKQTCNQKRLMRPLCLWVGKTWVQMPANLLCILRTSPFSDPRFSHPYNSSNFTVLL